MMGRSGPSWPFAIGLALIATIALSGPAGAYPVPREGHEKGVAPGRARLRIGRWTSEGQAHTLKPGGPSRAYLITRQRTGGFVRVKVRRAGQLDMAILFRASVVQRQPLALSGYGFSVNQGKGTIDFLRWDAGGVRDPGVRREVDGLADHEALEICIWIAGSAFTATVFDGLTKEPLASLSWSDPAYRKGDLGLYLKRGAGQPPLIEMSVPVAKPPKAGAAPPWLAPKWLVKLTQRTYRRLPKDLRSRFRRARVSPPGQAWLITDEVGAWALRDHGARLLSADPGLPRAVAIPRLMADREELIEEDGGKLAIAAGLKDEAMVERVVRAIAAAHPDRARLLELGTSAEGRSLLGLRIADDPDDTSRPALLLVAAHHAREVATPEFPIDAALQLLQGEDARTQAWLKAFAVVVVPLVNPDGSHAHWHIDHQFGRKNRRRIDPAAGANPGVDLNRNYPFRFDTVQTRFCSRLVDSDFYRGPGPASEPEVQAMIALAERERFAAAISYHGAATRILVPYTIGGLDNPEPSAAWTVAEQLMAGLTHTFKRRAYELVSDLYPVDGVEQDWYYHSFGTLAYLVEIPWNIVGRDRLEEELVHSRPAWQGLLDRWLAGPSLSVRAVDGQGEPVEAHVTIDGIRYTAGEHFTTNPTTGWFHHYLPGPGTYVVHLAAGQRTAFRKVEIQAGVERIELTL